jgi:hypothetical protein
MVQVSNLRIPEFIYLDDQKVDMTLSWIEGSIPVKSRSQMSRGKSKSGGGNLGFQGIIGVKGGLESSSAEEQEEVKEQNEYSKFARLYQLLQERDGITNLEKFDEEVRNQLKRGQIIEIESYVTLSPIDMLFRLFANVIPPIPNQNVGNSKEMDGTKVILSLLQQGQRKGIDAFIVSGENPEFRFYTSLLIDKFKASTDELPSTLITLGRVTKILEETETVNLLSKYFGGLRLPKDSLQDLVSKFSNDPDTAQMFGSAPSLDDMLIKYPAVALSPIAMYR